MLLLFLTVLRLKSQGKSADLLTLKSLVLERQCQVAAYGARRAQGCKLTPPPPLGWKMQPGNTKEELITD